MALPGAGALGFGAACEDDAGVGRPGVPDGHLDGFLCGDGTSNGQMGQRGGCRDHSPPRAAGGAAGRGAGADPFDREGLGAASRASAGNQANPVFPGYHDGRVSGPPAGHGLGESADRPGLERVAWREIKGAVIYRLEQAGQTAGGRGVIAQKQVVAWQGDPQAFGRRVQTEARRRGLASAREVFVVADGGGWIWHIQQDRFGQARGMLDFYHASEHLWAVARSLHPADETAARAWVEPLLSQLKHGQEAGVLQTLDNLPAWCVAQNRVPPPEVARERAYFQNHREHLHYEAMAALGCPNGSGMMESFCAQLQGRFKRCGQFWSQPGMADLLALEVARRNFDWDALWSQN